LYSSYLRLRDTSSRNTPPRRSEWGSSLPPEYFVSRGSISTLVILNIRFLRRGVVSTSPNPQARGPPLVGCPRLLIQFIRSCPPYRRPFLHPQPEDAPCRGDRDPHSWSCIALLFLNPGARWGWVVNATPRPLYPRERPGSHCIGGWVGPTPVWTGTENLDPTGIRPPDRPARSESLYRRSYTGP
jgi:hypothetical protein